MHAIEQQEQAALAAQKAEYLARAKAIFPTDEAAAERMAQQMMNMAEGSRSRRDKERDDERGGRERGRGSR